MAGSRATSDELRTGFEAKLKQAEALRTEIQRVQLEARLLRLGLLCNGVQDESVIPEGLGAGGSPEDPMLKFLEHKRLLEWLAEVCDLATRKTCNVVGDLYVAGYKAVIGHGVQWSLSVPDELSLTIPIELESTIVGILSKARRSLLSMEDLDRFASEWDMLSVEMCVEGEGMPGLFLIRREDSTAIVVSAWPKLPSLLGASHTLDPVKFFASNSNASSATAKAVFFGSDGLANTLSFSSDGRVHWHLEGSGLRRMSELGINFCACELPDEQFILTGPFGQVVIADPLPGAPQREIVEEIVSLSLENGLRVHHAQSLRIATPQQVGTSSSDNVLAHGVHLGDSRQRLAIPELEHLEASQLPPVVSKGDSVEVQYQGQWFSGVLQGVQGEFALVSCDADDPDIITVAPLRKVRAASYEGE